MWWVTLEYNQTNSNQSEKIVFHSVGLAQNKFQLAHAHNGAARFKNVHADNTLKCLATLTSWNIETDTIFTFVKGPLTWSILLTQYDSKKDIDGTSHTFQ